MTTSELKQQIDKVLGNSIRCLLPSYWWKKLFHQVADRIDDVEKSVEPKADKDYVDRKVNEAKESFNQVLFHAPIGGQLSTDKKVVNKQSYQRVMDGYSKGLYFETKVSGGFGILDSIMIISPDITGGQLKMIILNELGIGFQRLSVSSDGSATIEEIISTDSELSDTSTNPVQNKAIKSYVDDSSANVKDYTDAEVAKKVDKVEGKQLSTEDFTTALKTKLEGLSNYDDTEISNAVARLRDDFNSLTQEDISAAIENFNEIISFLDGIEDSESLDSIIASIEQQIANKQDKIEDLETIRSGAALGATALQEQQDISHLATKEEVTNLQNEVIANEEVSAAAFNNLHTRVEEIAANVGGSAATKEELAAAVATLEAADTATNTAVTAVDDKVDALESSVAETYATKTEVQTEVAALNETITTLQNEVIDNEEVAAASLNDINDKVKQLGADSETTYATKVALQAAVDTLNATILNNEEIIAAAFNDINGRLLSILSRLEALEANVQS